MTGDIEIEIQRLERRLAELKKRQSDLPVFPADRQRWVDDGVCLECGLELPDDPRQVVRGVHRNCHKRIMRWIEKGQITDDQCVQQGVMLAASKGGAKPKSGTRLTEIIAEQPNQVDEADRLTAEVEAEFSRDIELSIARERAAEFKAASKKRATKKKAE